ncbi:hypothetical protein BGZ63DRAFT_405619 [Mariannaea sp. PMI_226]|nr:hypothetical protein BGZ63DRAFT_405619 [Mariannaea sp. PMI_226]
MAELAAGVDAAIQIFQALEAAWRYISRAIEDWKTAEFQFDALLDDIKGCEQYATLVKRCLSEIPPSAMTPKDGAMIKKKLDSILNNATDFKMWTVKNMIVENDTDAKKRKKKFKVAFGKLREIRTKLRVQVEKLRAAAPEIMMRLQSLIFEGVYENQRQISSLHDKIDRIAEELARLSQLINQPPAYEDAVRDSSGSETKTAAGGQWKKSNNDVSGADTGSNKKETEEKNGISWTPFAILSAVAIVLLL